MAINYRSHFAYRIDAWDADGENVIEHLAGVEDPSSCEGNVPGRMSTLAGDTNHVAPRHTSNRRQSPDSDCVSALRRLPPPRTR